MSRGRELSAQEEEEAVIARPRGREAETGAPAPFSVANERDALASFLDLQRKALVRKLDGLSDEDARKAPTAGSLSLLGILKHSAIWERRWFQIAFAGSEPADEWPTDEDEGAENPEFAVGEADTVARWVAFYEEQVARSRVIAAGADLNTPCAMPKQARRNLRWVLLHMIEETARHAGHADIIRETLDGSRGV